MDSEPSDVVASASSAFLVPRRFREQAQREVDALRVDVGRLCTTGGLQNSSSDSRLTHGQRRPSEIEPFLARKLSARPCSTSPAPAYRPRPRPLADATTPSPRPAADTSVASATGALSPSPASVRASRSPVAALTNVSTVAAYEDAISRLQGDMSRLHAQVAADRVTAARLVAQEGRHAAMLCEALRRDLQVLGRQVAEMTVALRTVAVETDATRRECDEVRQHVAELRLQAAFETENCRTTMELQALRDEVAAFGSELAEKSQQAANDRQLMLDTATTSGVCSELCGGLSNICSRVTSQQELLAEEIESNRLTVQSAQRDVAAMSKLLEEEASKRGAADAEHCDMANFEALHSEIVAVTELVSEQSAGALQQKESFAEWRDDVYNEFAKFSTREDTTRLRNELDVQAQVCERYLDEARRSHNDLLCELPTLTAISTFAEEEHQIAVHERFAALRGEINHLAEQMLELRISQPEDKRCEIQGLSEDLSVLAGQLADFKGVSAERAVASARDRNNLRSELAMLSRSYEESMAAFPSEDLAGLRHEVSCLSKQFAPSSELAALQDEMHRLPQQIASLKELATEQSFNVSDEQKQLRKQVEALSVQIVALEDVSTEQSAHVSDKHSQLRTDVSTLRMQLDSLEERSAEQTSHVCDENNQLRSELVTFARNVAESVQGSVAENINMAETAQAGRQAVEMQGFRDELSRLGAEADKCESELQLVAALAKASEQRQADLVSLCQEVVDAEGQRDAMCGDLAEKVIAVVHESVECEAATRRQGTELCAMARQVARAEEEGSKMETLTEQSRADWNGLRDELNSVTAEFAEMGSSIPTHSEIATLVAGVREKTEGLRTELCALAAEVVRDGEASEQDRGLLSSELNEVQAKLAEVAKQLADDQEEPVASAADKAVSTPFAATVAALQARQSTEGTGLAAGACGTFVPSQQWASTAELGDIRQELARLREELGSLAEWITMEQDPSSPDRASGDPDISTPWTPSDKPGFEAISNRVSFTDWATGAGSTSEALDEGRPPLLQFGTPSEKGSQDEMCAPRDAAPIARFGTPDDNEDENQPMTPNFNLPMTVDAMEGDEEDAQVTLEPLTSPTSPLHKAHSAELQVHEDEVALAVTRTRQPAEHSFAKRAMQNVRRDISVLEERTTSVQQDCTELRNEVRDQVAQISARVTAELDEINKRVVRQDDAIKTCCGHAQDVAALAEKIHGVEDVRSLCESLRSEIHGVGNVRSACEALHNEIHGVDGVRSVCESLRSEFSDMLNQLAADKQSTQASLAELASRREVLSNDLYSCQAGHGELSEAVAGLAADRDEGRKLLDEVAKQCQQFEVELSGLSARLPVCQESGALVGSLPPAAATAAGWEGELAVVRDELASVTKDFHAQDKGMMEQVAATRQLCEHVHRKVDSLSQGQASSSSSSKGLPSRQIREAHMAEHAARGASQALSSPGSQTDVEEHGGLEQSSSPVPTARAATDSMTPALAQRSADSVRRISSDADTDADGLAAFANRSAEGHAVASSSALRKPRTALKSSSAGHGERGIDEDAPTLQTPRKKSVTIVDALDEFEQTASIVQKRRTRFNSLQIPEEITERLHHHLMLAASATGVGTEGLKRAIRKLDQERRSTIVGYAFKHLIRRELNINPMMVSDNDVQAFIAALDHDGSEDLATDDVLDFIDYGPNIFRQESGQVVDTVPGSRRMSVQDFIGDKVELW